MDIERADDAASHRLSFLMRMLTNLNAGGMLALCLWLSWAALDFNAGHTQDTGTITLHGCGCSLEAIAGQGRVNASVDRR